MVLRILKDQIYSDLIAFKVNGIGSSRNHDTIEAPVKWALGMSDHNSYKKRHELDLTVTIRYYGLKATQYFSKWNQQSMAVLRDDLIALKIPSPKAENVILTSHGCVEFSWFGVEPYKILHNNLIRKLAPNTPDGQQTLSELLKDLSITSAIFRTTPAGSTAFVPKTKKRPHSTVPEPSEYPRKKFAPGPPSNPEAAAAEKFLSDTLKTLKSEPVDVLLPPHVSPVRKSRFEPAPHPLPLRPHAAELPAAPAYPLPSPAQLVVSAAPIPGASDDMVAYKALMKELWTLRKQVSFGLSREQEVINEIKKLRPNANAALSDPKQREIAALKVELEEAKQRLENERKHNRELQTALDDLRQEAKEPFIVPGLIDAFLSISKLASQIR